MGTLIDKIIKRQKEIEEHKNKLVEFIGTKSSSLNNKEELLAGVNELSKLNAQEFGKILE